jgi:hypothetical protein
MDRETVDLLDQQAGQIAAANPPSKVALTVIAFAFTALGFAVGCTWFYVFKAVTFCWLAARYGYSRVALRLGSSAGGRSFLRKKKPKKAADDGRTAGPVPFW